MHATQTRSAAGPDCVSCSRARASSYPSAAACGQSGASSPRRPQHAAPAQTRAAQRARTRRRGGRPAPPPCHQSRHSTRTRVRARRRVGTRPKSDRRAHWACCSSQRAESAPCRGRAAALRPPERALPVRAVQASTHGQPHSNRGARPCPGTAPRTSVVENDVEELRKRRRRRRRGRGRLSSWTAPQDRRRPRPQRRVPLARQRSQRRHPRSGPTCASPGRVEICLGKWASALARTLRVKSLQAAKFPATFRGGALPALAHSPARPPASPRLPPAQCLC